ncbi:MAG: outer membrane lipoprotein carrier protein LolA [Nibricoccus sp.]
MKRLALLLLFGSLSLCAADLAEPGPKLIAGQNDAEWMPLFNELGSRRSVVSEFTEHRWFPFKKIPVVLKGVMRLAPNLGMSLGYTEPEPRVVIIDSKGLLLRDASGRQREVPADPDSPALTTALLPILNFDWKKLDQTFTVFAAREGDKWRLDFVPRDAQIAGKLGRIIALGDGNRMQQLEFRRSAMQRVEIFIGETRQGVEFSPDETKRYFR